MSTTIKGTELDGSPSTAPGEVRSPSTEVRPDPCEICGSTQGVDPCLEFGDALMCGPCYRRSYDAGMPWPLAEALDSYDEDERAENSLCAPAPKPFDFDAVAVPSRYLAYAGDEIQWPEGRTISGYVNSAKVRKERAVSRVPMGGGR